MLLRMGRNSSVTSVWQQIPGWLARGEGSCGLQQTTEHQPRGCAASSSCQGMGSPSFFPVLPCLWGMAEFWMQQRGPSGQAEPCRTKIFPVHQDVQCPEHFCAFFVFPVAFPWHEAGQFLACLLFHLYYICSLSLLGWVSGPQRSTTLIFLLQYSSGQDVSVPHWMEVRARLWQC